MKKSILDVIHESAKGLFDIGVMDAKTMRSFDAMRAIDVGLDSLKKGNKVSAKDSYDRLKKKITKTAKDQR